MTAVVVGGDFDVDAVCVVACRKSEFWGRIVDFIRDGWGNLAQSRCADEWHRAIGIFGTSELMASIEIDLRNDEEL